MKEAVPMTYVTAEITSLARNQWKIPITNPVGGGTNPDDSRRYAANREGRDHASTLRASSPRDIL